jgi:pimeloyl-ACP methyl ester carboxylesterase
MIGDRTLAIAVALSVGGWLTAAHGQTLVPRFETIPCEAANRGGIEARMTCGTVHVPRDHAKPDAGSFALAVTILGSAEQLPAVDPVVWLSQWPPGHLMISLYTLEKVNKTPPMPFAASRDFIFVDARGSGKSEPVLCPDLPRQVRSWSIVEGDAEAAAQRRQAYLACHDELIRQGIDLSQFGAAITARDMDWVRRALGVERWNAYGLSSGTPAALALTALYPQTVRTLTLVSPTPPEPSPPRSAEFAAARDGVFAACAQDAACARDYPDLAGTYREVLKRFDDKPASFDVRRIPVRPKDDGVRLTGAAVELAVYHLVQSPEKLRILPYIITATAEGDDAALAMATMFASMTANILTADALATSVECHDRPGLREALPAGASILDRLDLYGICDRWSKPVQVPPMPEGSSVPTLILGAPPALAGQSMASQEIARRIGPAARLMEVSGIDADIRNNNPCVWKVAAEFIVDPTKKPNASCDTGAQPLRFTPRAEGLRGTIRITP